MDYRTEFDGDTEQLKLSSAVFSKWGSICDILEHADLLDKGQSTSVFLTCAEHSITPGEFLYSSKAMPADLVRAAILCQLMIRDHLMTLAVATQAIVYVAKYSCSLETALEDIGWNRSYFEHLKLSCCLIQDAHIIDKAERETLQEIAVLQQIPLVQVMQDRQIITRELADVSLNLESLVYLESIDYGTAVELLILCRRENLDLSSAIERLNLTDLAKRVKARLGTLLVASGLVRPDDLLTSVEKALVSKRMLGEVLVADKLLTEDELQEVLDAQAKIVRGELSIQTVVGFLKSLRGGV